LSGRSFFVFLLLAEGAGETGAGTGTGEVLVCGYSVSFGF
jgi:hypothetical protein